jgi:hypothetical protein
MIISKLADLSQFVESSGADRMIFRGQANKDIFREFTDKSRPHRDSNSPWEILVLAQHYGTPTRLLDWTTNAYIALYFAAISSPAIDGAIWCATPARLPMPPWIGRIHDQLGYRRERLSEYVPERDLPFCVQDSKTAVTFGGGTGPTAAARTFDQNGDPDLSGVLTFLIAENTNNRIAAQTGLFSVYLGREMDEVVLDHETYIRTVETHAGTQILTKLIVPGAAKPGLRRSLERTGIDARVIFPDLQGLGLYLNTWQQNLVEEIS